MHIGLMPKGAGLGRHPSPLGEVIASPNVPGERITITGTLFDGDAAPVKDALIEVWQADAAGVYSGQGETYAGFIGWGRTITDADTGNFTIKTIKPGAVAPTDAPHLNLWIIARGINIGLHTRVYFDDEPQANATDPLLQKLEETNRQNTLIARKNTAMYHFNIYLQGADETVFLDV